MAITGSSENQTVKVVKEKKIITWNFCPFNPITQVIEYFYNQRKNNG
jgi:hypothetical protein